MIVELLLALGLVSSFQPGDPCIDALHEMRVIERLRIVSTEVLEDNVIAFTLTDGPRISDKTAILVCRVVEEAQVEDDGDAADLEEMAVEDVETLDDATDGSAEDDPGEEAAAQ
jgi:hypothetical protein